jgi:hypothetical protein
VLFIRIYANKLNALDIFIYHAVYRIVSAAAYTYDHDPGRGLDFVVPDF